MDHLSSIHNGYAMIVKEERRRTVARNMGTKAKAITFAAEPKNPYYFVLYALNQVTLLLIVTK